MKVTVIPIVIGALVTIPKGGVNRLKDLEIGQVGTIQTTTLLRSAKILRNFLSFKPSAKAGVNNSPTIIIIINKKKRTCKIVDFDVPADHKIKLKECKKKDKYLGLARELKKLWNMQMTIIPIVIGAFGTVTKGLLKGLEDLDVGGRVETIQTTTLLSTARILRRVLETWGDLLSFKLQWKTIS